MTYDSLKRDCDGVAFDAEAKFSWNFIVPRPHSSLVTTRGALPTRLNRVPIGPRVRCWDFVAGDDARGVAHAVKPRAHRAARSLLGFCRW